MTPVYQDKFGDVGNCFQACLASILEMPLEQVPDFCNMGAGWWFHYQTWLRQRGLTCLLLTGPLFLPGDFYYIASGQSPRGFPHSTVWRHRELVHDPHPDGGGIAEVMEVKILLPLDLTGLLRFLEPAAEVSIEIANRWPCPFKKDLCVRYQDRLWRVMKPMVDAKQAAEVKI